MSNLKKTWRLFNFLKNWCETVNTYLIAQFTKVIVVLLYCLLYGTCRHQMKNMKRQTHIGYWYYKIKKQQQPNSSNFTCDPKILFRSHLSKEIMQLGQKRRVWFPKSFSMTIYSTKFEWLLFFYFLFDLFGVCIIGLPIPYMSPTPSPMRQILRVTELGLISFVINLCS